MHKMARALLIASLFLHGCPLPTAQLPSSDSKAPILTWEVIDTKTSVHQNFNGNATVQAKVGDSFNVLLHATNPGGVHEIVLSGDSTWFCKSGDIGEKIGPGLLSPLKQDFTPDAKNQVPTAVSLTMSFRLARLARKGSPRNRLPPG